MSTVSEQIRKLETEVTTLKLQHKHFERQLSLIHSWKWTILKAAVSLPIFVLVFSLLNDPNAILHGVYATLLVLIVGSVLHILRSRFMRDR